MMYVMITFREGIITTIGLIVDYDDVTPSNGPRVIKIEDPDGYQLDVTIWDWDPTLAEK